MGRKSKTMSAPVTLAPTRWMIIRTLLALSAAVALYLFWTAAKGGQLLGCGPDSNCHGVLASRWAYWLGFPVSGAALVLYSILFGATFSTGALVPAPRRQMAWAILVLGAFLMVAAAAWFIALQIFVLRQICPYCLLAHTCAVIAGLLILRGAPILPKAPGAKVKEPTLFLSAAALRAISCAAIAGFAVLVLGQSVLIPKTYAVKSTAPGAAASREPQIPRAREIELHHGQFKLSVENVPVIGRPELPQAMVSLFDYTCHHCRQMHGFLVKVQQSYSNQLVIANLPVPLDGQCNPLMKRTPRAHTNACAYARLGLAVWRADRTKMEAYDSWIFGPASPPPVDEARAHAEQLVGREGLARALNDVWIDQQLRQDIAIYEANYKHFGNSAMPQLMMGTNVVFGSLEEAEDLDTLVRSSLPLRAQ